MICRTCGNRAAYTIRTVIEDGKPLDSCEGCGAAGFMTSADVYFDKPGTHHGLYNASGEPIFVTCKTHKAQVMKQQRLREAGDRVRGATSYDPVYARVAKANFRKQLEKETSHGRRN